MQEQRSTTDSANLTPSIKPAIYKTTSSPANSSTLSSTAVAPVEAPPSEDVADDEVAVELPPPMAEIQSLAKDTLTPEVSQSELVSL